MLKFTKRAVIALFATTCLASMQTVSADDAGRQFAAGILQVVANGLSNGGYPPGFAGPGYVPPVSPAGPGYYPPVGPGYYPPIGPSYPPVAPVVNPNPVVYDSGVAVTGSGVDPWGRPFVQTSQSMATASAYDPNRGTIDPGSWRTSSSIVTDQFGNTYQETTNSWTSFGVPHSETNQQLISQSASGVSVQEGRIYKGAPQRGGRNPRSHGRR